MTQKEKIEQFDALKQSEQNLLLALSDLVNGRFSCNVRINPKQFDADEQGCYLMKVSPRPMPLYLVAYELRGQGKQVWVWTEDEIIGMISKRTGSTFSRVLHAGLQMLTPFAYPPKEERCPCDSGHPERCPDVGLEVA